MDRLLLVLFVLSAPSDHSATSRKPSAAGRSLSDEGIAGSRAVLGIGVVSERASESGPGYLGLWWRSLVRPGEGLPAADPLAREGVYDEWIKSQRSRAAALLAATADRVRRAAGLPVSTALLEGSPKEAILDEAERWGADLIVVGSHGFGAVKRFLLGSVSHALALYAPCSVAIVRRRA